MMGRAGSSSTIGAMHIGSGLLAYAAGRAMTDGIQRAGDLAAEDHAHAVGQRYYAQRMAQRRAAVRADAQAAKAELLAMRARIHGE